MTLDRSVGTQPTPPASIGLYVHIPWCVRKCPYCDFNSHELHGPLGEDEYVSCLLRDLDTELTRTSATIDTVYFGGGTPSLFRPNSFARILDHPALQSVREVTMEANPGAVECGSFDDYRQAGINRVSIGVQSLNSDSLVKLGRIHSPEEARAAVEKACDVDFHSVNVDMMFGLPNQSVEMAMDDLDALIALKTEHISWYQLTIEPNTVFGKRPPTVASDDDRADMCDEGLERLADAGYRQYEVSGFAAESGEFECRHNVNYWRFGDYLGIGAGAHGKVTLDDGTIVRTQKTRRPEDYMRDQKTRLSEIDRVELPVEFMMNVLRINDGVENDHFVCSTGLSLQALQPVLSQLREENLVERHRISLTDLGRNHLNSIVERFL
ncbi:MAG: radical SAM family heme chaperone HemW [Gammaproteobacteria bacterium]|nr:radical SAM family heme chaperone HemW [Gammaproteobacteria bacterium]